MMEGMAMVLGEAVERLPRLPRNFPTSNVFDWSSEEYEYYQRAPVTTVSLPRTESTTSPSQPLHGMDIKSIVVLSNALKHNLKTTMNAFCESIDMINGKPAWEAMLLFC